MGNITASPLIPLFVPVLPLSSSVSYCLSPWESVLLVHRGSAAQPLQSVRKALRCRKGSWGEGLQILTQHICILGAHIEQRSFISKACSHRGAVCGGLYGLKSSTVVKSAYLRCLFLLLREVSPDQSFPQTAGLTALLCFVSNNTQNSAAGYWGLWQEFCLFFWISFLKLHPNLLVRLFEKLLDTPSEFTGAAQGNWPSQHTWIVQFLWKQFQNTFKWCVRGSVTAHNSQWEHWPRAHKSPVPQIYFQASFTSFPLPIFSIKRTLCYCS